MLQVIVQMVKTVVAHTHLLAVRQEQVVLAVLVLVRLQTHMTMAGQVVV